MLALQILGFLIFLLVWLGVSPYIGWMIVGVFHTLGVSFDLSVIIANTFVLAVPISIFVYWIIRRMWEIIR